MAFAGDQEVASDAVNEAFAQALARAGEIREPAKWVWRAAFRIASGELKQRRRLVPPAEGRGAADPAAEPAAELLSALAKLPPKQRAALVLHYYADLPTRDIAVILGSSAATVRVHLSVGRKRLRGLLEAEDV